MTMAMIAHTCASLPRLRRRSPHTHWSRTSRWTQDPRTVLRLPRGSPCSTQGLQKPASENTSIDTSVWRMPFPLLTEEARVPGESVSHEAVHGRSRSLIPRSLTDAITMPARTCRTCKPTLGTNRGRAPCLHDSKHHGRRDGSPGYT